MDGVNQVKKVLISINSYSSYGLGNDFNHKALILSITLKELLTWIEEFKIDGIRWDLTKILLKTVMQVMMAVQMLINKIE